jgi:hypothetical protein
MSIGTVSKVNLVCKQKLPLDEATNNQNEREDSKSKYLTMTDRWRKKNTTTNSKRKRAESSEGTPRRSLRSDGTLTAKKNTTVNLLIVLGFQRLVGLLEVRVVLPGTLRLGDVLVDGRVHLSTSATFPLVIGRWCVR